MHLYKITEKSRKASETTDHQDIFEGGNPVAPFLLAYREGIGPASSVL